MTVFAQNAWADIFNSEDHRQSQQQTAYLLLKGKAEEQLGLSEVVFEPCIEVRADCTLRVDGRVIRAELTSETAIPALREAQQWAREARALLAATIATGSR